MRSLHYLKTFQKTQKLCQITACNVLKLTVMSNSPEIPRNTFQLIRLETIQPERLYPMHPVYVSKPLTCWQKKIKEGAILTNEIRNQFGASFFATKMSNY